MRITTNVSVHPPMPLQMTARISNVLLFLHHFAKRLVKKVLLLGVGLLVTAYLLLTLSRENDSTSASHSEEKNDHFGRGRVSSNLLLPKYSKLDTFMVVCILSAPNNVQARLAARESWLTLLKQKDPDNTGPRSVQPLFVVGGQDLDVEVFQSLHDEMNLYHDLLILDNLVDSYANLTLKVVHAYSWINANLRPQYVIKCDDDSYVRLDLIAEELKRPRLSMHQRLYWGFFDGRARPFKKGKWSETTWNLCDLYLPYALGGGYVVSANLVSFVARNAPDLRLFFNEDVAMGTWMAPLDVDRVHDTRFDTEYKSRGCFSSYLITHKQTPELLREKHKNLIKTGSICGGPQNEFRSRLSYDYNWAVPPSQCCHRGSNDLP